MLPTPLPKRARCPPSVVMSLSRPNLARPQASITLKDNVGILKIIRPAMKMVPLFGSVLEGA